MSSIAQAGNFTVTTMAGDDSAGSLHAAIESANANLDQDQITFASNLNGSINLTQSLPNLVSPMTITGPGKDVITVNGVDQYLIFNTYSTTKISGLTLANGDGGTGGAINSHDPLEIDGVRITGAEDQWKGGAIFADEADSLVVKNSIITDNEAELGGGINTKQTDTTISNTEISDNKSTDGDKAGGGLYSEDSDLTITDSEFTGNTAYAGGGILATRLDDAINPKIEITDTKFDSNKSTSPSTDVSAGGAGAKIEAAETTITGSEFTDNTATGQVGALLIVGNAEINSSLIADNKADFGAGVVAQGSSPSDPATVSISDSTITGNVAATAISGVAISYGTTSVESSTISGNTVTAPMTLAPFYATAGFTQFYGTGTVKNSIVSGNSPADYAAPTDLPGGTANSAIKAAYSLMGTSADNPYSDLVPGSNIPSADPMLGPLADNGGDLRTMLPSQDSPVIDKGLSASGVDARGLTRVVDLTDFANAAGGNGSDIGAVELQTSEYKPPTPPAPSNNFSFGWYKVNRKTGIASLQVRVPGAGKLVVVGSKTVASSKTTAKKASTAVVKIKAKGKALKTVRKKGKVKVKAKVTFTPTGGKPRTKTKTIKLSMTKKGR
jgi:hypothetical protein